MAAVEFIEKMDALSLKIDGEAYEALMQESISEFNQHHESSSTSSSSSTSTSTSFNAKMDLAEAKAEEFLLKAKEAFKATGEKANQAISTFKESSLAKKSMERIQAFMKDMGTESESVDEAEEVEKAKEREYEEHLSRAISMSLSKEVAEEEVDALALINNTDERSLYNNTDELDNTTNELSLDSTTDATITTTINTDNDNDPTTTTTTTTATSTTTTTTAT